MPRMARLILERVGRDYPGGVSGPVRAVSELDLVVEERDFLVLLGPSGCGKTTTLRMIAGLEEPTSGTISIDGQEVNHVPPQKRDIAMVFQHHALYPHMTARENLAFGLKVRRTPRAEIESRVREAAEMLELKDCLERRPAELSGGQRQRVALGRAMVRRPKIFLFDEPLSHLDAQLRGQMRKEITRLHSRLGATIIYVTHDQAEALTLGSRVAVMSGGRLQQVARPLELYQQPASLFVAGFVGSPPMNFFRGIISENGGGIYFEEKTAANSSRTGFKLPLSGAAAGQIKGRVGSEVQMGLRPEHILVTEGNELLTAEVRDRENLGPDSHLYLASAGHEFVARIAGPCSTPGGAVVRVRFEIAQACFFDPGTGKLIA